MRMLKETLPWILALAIYIILVVVYSPKSPHASHVQTRACKDSQYVENILYR
jgi:hypothetical protein